MYLHKLLDEADYYQLTDLAELVAQELEGRELAQRLRTENETRDATEDLPDVYVYMYMMCMICIGYNAMRGGYEL